MAFVLAAILNTGCRSALSPDIDRNRPPETWISAAPQDSITIRNRDGTIQRPRIGTIPYRFHMYWAGSDRDGAVTGFYWAVVETLPLPPDGVGQIPPLPGPRASDYHYTSRTDSVFNFNVSEFRPDRQHAFYIYAVDDKGKADPTPARFIFNALDRFPPLVLFDICDPRPAHLRPPGKKGCDDGGYGGSATGKIARVLSPGTVTLFDTTVYITDSLDLRNPSAAPRDTIPSTARIDFAWHSEPTVVGGEAQRYKYKLDEPQFNDVDASARAVSYNAGVGTLPIRPGPKQFTLRALDAAGGAREVTRKFQMNWAPDTWFAGPDPAMFPVQPGGERYETPNFAVLEYPGTTLSCDSLLKWPSERRPRKTFWEVWKERIYIRSDEDTVHMNSWLIIPTGGRDDDSPYAVKVDRNDPVLDTVTCAPGGNGRVVRPAGLTGQPIGFRLGYAHKLDPNYFSINTPTTQSLYPFFELSPFRKPEINGYIAFQQSGRVYLMARAQDGDGATDNSLGEAIAASDMADRVDRGMGTAQEVKLRTKIFTFYVNKSPYFLFGESGFFPKPPAYNGGNVDSSDSRRLDLNLSAADDDPFDFGNRPEPGGPSPNSTTRFHVTVHGRDSTGRDTFYVAPRVFVPTQTIDLDVDAPYIRNTDLTLTIELCDCATCETQSGTGRCVYQTIPVIVPPPPTSLGLGRSRSTLARHPSSSRPGSRYEP